MNQKRRRKEGKTDYKSRIALLRSGKARVIFRKTNKYVIGQYVKSKEAKDKVIIGAVSKELLEYGFSKEASGSLKSISASYLTGFLMGKKILSLDGKEEIIFDLGILRSVQKSRAYGFLKGLVDSGIKMKYEEKIFPEERKIKGENLKIKINFNKIKENIEKKFV